MHKNAKIEVISFVAMLCVVWWHCYCGSSIERWFIPGFCVWSVPWFFFLSGVLFRKTIDSKPYSVVIRSKIRSLLMPYIIWSCIGAIITSTIPFRVSMFDGALDIFCISSKKIHPWGNNALWYVRSLLIFMLLTVPIDYINKKLLGNRRYFTMICLLALVLLISHYFVSLGPSSSGFYFAAGMSVSERILGCKTDCSRKSVILCGLCFMSVAALLRLIWFCAGYDLINSGGTALANVSVCFLIVGMWHLSDLIPVRFVKSNIIHQFLPLTAFVYFMHYPINDWIKYTARSFNSECLFVTLVVCAPIAYLSLAWSIKKYFSRIYSVLSGGR